MSKRKHYLVYQINDNKNKKIYIGVHVTQNVNDSYMGSGTALRTAIKDYGIENFSKTILYDFDNDKDMLNKEAELVNKEFIERNDTYNIILGGGFITTGYITVVDDCSNYYFVALDDPRYLSGEFKTLGAGYTTVIDENGNHKRINTHDSDYIEGCYRNVNYGYLTALSTISGKTCRMKNTDPRFLSGEYIHCTSNTIVIRNKEGKIFRVSSSDPRYLSGEFVGITKDICLSKEHILKIKKTMKEKFQSGQTNSQYGTMWICNIQTKENKKILKSDVIPIGWSKGRIMK